MPFKIQDGRRLHGNRCRNTQFNPFFFKIFYQRDIVTKYENNVVSNIKNHHSLHVSPAPYKVELVNLILLFGLSSTHL